MRFNPGDWVEITDDRAELEGTAGVMRQIQSVDDATQTITLSSALPAGLLLFDGAGPDLDQSLHPRVRRWDQAGVVRDSAGTMLLGSMAAFPARRVVFSFIRSDMVARAPGLFRRVVQLLREVPRLYFDRADLEALCAGAGLRDLETWTFAEQLARFAPQASGRRVGVSQDVGRAGTF